MLTDLLHSEMAENEGRRLALAAAQASGRDQAKRLTRANRKARTGAAALAEAEARNADLRAALAGLEDEVALVKAVSEQIRSDSIEAVDQVKERLARAEAQAAAERRRAEDASADLRQTLADLGEARQAASDAQHEADRLAGALAAAEEALSAATAEVTDLLAAVERLSAEIGTLEEERDSLDAVGADLALTVDVLREELGEAEEALAAEREAAMGAAIDRAAEQMEASRAADQSMLERLADSINSSATAQDDALRSSLLAASSAREAAQARRIDDLERQLVLVESHTRESSFAAAASTADLEERLRRALADLQASRAEVHKLEAALADARLALDHERGLRHRLEREIERARDYVGAHHLVDSEPAPLSFASASASELSWPPKDGVSTVGSGAEPAFGEGSELEVLELALERAKSARGSAIRPVLSRSEGARGDRPDPASGPPPASAGKKLLWNLDRYRE